MYCTVVVSIVALVGAMPSNTEDSATGIACIYGGGHDSCKAASITFLLFDFPSNNSCVS